MKTSLLAGIVVLAAITVLAQTARKPLSAMSDEQLHVKTEDLCARLDKEWRAFLRKDHQLEVRFPGRVHQYTRTQRRRELRLGIWSGVKPLVDAEAQPLEKELLRRGPPTGSKDYRKLFDNVARFADMQDWAQTHYLKGTP